jgi:hypothetical protein
VRLALQDWLRLLDLRLPLVLGLRLELELLPLLVVEVQLVVQDYLIPRNLGKQGKQE